MEEALELKMGENVFLMVVDTAFTSTGLNYFTAAVPKVGEFRKACWEWRDKILKTCESRNKRAGKSMER